MKKWTLETTVGAFMVLGLACLGYLAVELGDLRLFERDRYVVQARFISSSGLKEGADVEVGGVPVGVVSRIALDPETYESVVELDLPRSVRIQRDAIASIRTSGIIGDKFVKVSPGGDETLLASGEEIVETESSISIEELISKYIFDGGGKP